MTHQLTRDQHREVHQKHVESAGGWASRQIRAEIGWDALEDAQKAALIATHSERLPIGPWSVILEMCVRCGFTEHVTCSHSYMFWTHRPGCRRYDPATISVPEGLVKPLAGILLGGNTGTDNCAGCLLLCPICGADGT